MSESKISRTPTNPKVDMLPPPEPLKAIVYSDMPRYLENKDSPLPEELQNMAGEVVRLSKQGVSFGALAGRLGVLPEEFRRLCIEYPDLQRAMAFGIGIGSDQMTEKLYNKGAQEGDMTAITLWLKARGGFEPPKPSGGSVAVKSGEVTVSIDLDRIRNMSVEQSNLIEGELG